MSVNYPSVYGMRTMRLKKSKHQRRAEEALLKCDDALHDLKLINEALEGYYNEKGIDFPSKMWEAAEFGGWEIIKGDI